ncbi:DUF397 domain-containing protein [Streptomyces sp. NBC_00190]|uniref:DUF397 domain-containing protein n=1 Tax=unclassified Streptomyces TaxID=2593676 RepID=UPI002E27F14C|nr:DUF397 domain-containing protein [Streptomyces sp. NBC_00190]WSZ40996.1 DUF397 domain-containing protein [Streptomyces sp. NBC_00868]
MTSTREYDLSAATWHKSSYSDGTGGDCLEMATWRKSPHSGASGGDTVPVRDSKVPDGPHLTFNGPAWAAFVTSL